MQNLEPRTYLVGFVVVSGFPKYLIWKFAVSICSPAFKYRINVPLKSDNAQKVAFQCLKEALAKQYMFGISGLLPTVRRQLLSYFLCLTWGFTVAEVGCLLTLLRYAFWDLSDLPFALLLMWNIPFVVMAALSVLLWTSRSRGYWVIDVNRRFCSHFLLLVSLGPLVSSFMLAFRPSHAVSVGLTALLLVCCSVPSFLGLPLPCGLCCM